MTIEASVDRDGVRDRMTDVDSTSSALLLVGSAKVEVGVACVCNEEDDS